MFANGSVSKAGEPQYCLQWNNHSSNLAQKLEKLYLTGSLTDVTLVCEGTSIQSHKIILAACSSVFQDLFIENESRNMIVFIKDVKLAELKDILTYMYRGELTLSRDQLGELIKAAQILKVKGFVEETQQLPNQMPDVPFVTEFHEFQDASFPVTQTINAAASTETKSANFMPLSSRNVSWRGFQNESVPPRKIRLMEKDETKPKACSGTIILNRMGGNSSSAPAPEHAKYERNGSFATETGQHGVEDCSINIEPSYQLLYQKKRYKKYTGEQLSSAIESVRQGMNPYKAAVKFHIPARTLYDRVKKLGITSNKYVSSEVNSREDVGPSDNPENLSLHGEMWAV